MGIRGLSDWVTPRRANDQVPSNIEVERCTKFPQQLRWSVGTQLERGWNWEVCIMLKLAYLCYLHANNDKHFLGQIISILFPSKYSEV
jgi:hypothetical protein